MDEPTPLLLKRWKKSADALEKSGTRADERKEEDAWNAWSAQAHDRRLCLYCGRRWDESAYCPVCAAL